MAKKCVVPNCSNIQNWKSALMKITFHRIPKKPALRNIWLKRLRLSETAINGRICSKHFEPNDFVLKGRNQHWLRSNACPIPQVSHRSAAHIRKDKWNFVKFVKIDDKNSIDIVKHRTSEILKSHDQSFETNVDDRKEIEINILDLPHSEATIDLQMNCSVFPIYHSYRNTYAEHNYSKFARKNGHFVDRRELCFDIKFCDISSTVSEIIS